MKQETSGATWLETLGAIMPEDNGLIRWRDLSTALGGLRAELKTDTRDIEAAQNRNVAEITELKAEIASLKTELRIMGVILIGALLALITMFVNHLGVP